MKKLLFIGLILTTLTFSGCIIVDTECVACDIYDEYGHWVKDYGEFCGSYYECEEYEEDADRHARRFYNGWAECYYN
jgi:hypothetical protein